MTYINRKAEFSQQSNMTRAGEDAQEEWRESVADGFVQPLYGVEMPGFYLRCGVGEPGKALMKQLVRDHNEVRTLRAALEEICYDVHEFSQGNLGLVSTLTNLRSYKRARALLSPHPDAADQFSSRDGEG
jgi:hypothetical protein